ncbi:hypothetical protein LCGC14_0019080 [marine sediment metagenome]|uniref:Transmembrane protein n=1 Tax=marine sediment metagenome TaxID=412755 RepID=A0A0F9YGP9_9ZZZZ
MREPRETKRIGLAPSFFTAVCPFPKRPTTTTITTIVLALAALMLMAGPQDRLFAAASGASALCREQWRCELTYPSAPSQLAGLAPTCMRPLASGPSTIGADPSGELHDGRNDLIRKGTHYPLEHYGGSILSSTAKESTNRASAGDPRNLWSYYFSSLAQTVAGASAILVALAVIRLQSIDNSLNGIERLIADAFFRIDKQDHYRGTAFVHFLNEDWHTYFEDVAGLASESENSFSSSDRYVESRGFVESLVERGCVLHSRKVKLHRALSLAFGGTIMFAGTAILLLPAGQWVSVPVMYSAWVGSGLLLVLLFTAYLRLVLSTARSHKEKSS